jgi:large subunit ribosomal protein L25
MAAGRETLKVASRDGFGSRESRRLRRAGLVPGVVYAGGRDARPFQVDEREMATFLSNGHTLFDLEIEGSKAVPVVVKEQQHHPVRGQLLHIDCLEVKLDEAIQAEVALELRGAEEAPGVDEGGVLEHVTREVTIEALPGDIPEVIHADVSEMVIGDTLQLASVPAPSGVTYVADDLEEVTVATLSPPRIEEEPEPELEEEAELVGEEGEVPEGEEAPEGEAVPEGEAAEGEGGPGEGGAEGGEAPRGE